MNAYGQSRQTHSSIHTGWKAAPRRGEGFNQRDFALRNASWLISDIISDRGGDEGKREGFQASIGHDTPVAPDQVEVDDPAAQSAEIKRIAKFFGGRSLRHHRL